MAWNRDEETWDQYWDRIKDDYYDYDDPYEKWNMMTEEEQDKIIAENKAKQAELKRKCDHIFPHITDHNSNFQYCSKCKQYV